jgi:hypothetical protein
LLFLLFYSKNRFFVINFCIISAIFSHNPHHFGPIYPQVSSLSNASDIGFRLIALTIRELFELRFMQTDPSFANYLYCGESDVVHLVDFGAARGFAEGFVREFVTNLGCFLVIWGDLGLSGGENLSEIG